MLCLCHDISARLEDEGLVDLVAVGLQDAFELSQKLPRALAGASEPEVEHHAAAGRPVLP